MPLCLCRNRPLKIDKNPMINIRRATATDCAPVELLARAAYQKYVERIGKEPAPMIADFSSQINEGKVLVVVDINTVVAFAVCYPLNNEFHLENIAVSPDCQAGGVGTRLLEAVEQQAKQGGFDVISLYTNEKMVENLAWYKKTGFSETGRYFKDGFNRVYFKKSL